MRAAARAAAEHAARSGNLFKPQLRVLLRASAFGDVRMMLPTSASSLIADLLAQKKRF